MRPSHGSRRQGAVLLEVIVALAVLAMVGSSAAWMCSEALRAVSHAHAAEAGMRAAERLMVAVSLWPTEDLDRHLGSTRQGPWRLLVLRPRPNLYEVTLTDTVAGGVLLSTALWRQETPLQ
jgi:type II secretory pathway component PulJ